MDWTILFMTTLLFSTLETTKVIDAELNECCPSSGIPPAPRIILLGQTGIGKSTLGNRLLGKKPGMCSSTNSLLDPTHPVFGVGHDMESHTNETSWISGRWLGIKDNPCVTIIDTPGIGDSEGRDCIHAKQIAQVVREIGDIHGFLLLVKGSDNRFSDFLQEQLIMFNEIFGPTFWSNVAFEITFWKHNPNDIEDRLEDQKIDEQKRTSQWNHQVQKLFSPVPEIPVMFVDPVFKELRAEEAEKEIFKRETDKLWDLINTTESYSCIENSCQDKGFTEGIPTLLTNNAISSRVGGKLALTWQVWFGDCGNQTGIRSYTVEFTNPLGENITVFTMIDKQNKGRDVYIAKDPTKHDGFPANAIVEDKCSKNTKTNECDNTNSKYKTVTFIFNIIHEKDFGKYSLVNSVGRSKQVNVRKITDGTWGEWSQYSPCSRTCLSLEDNQWGEKFRTRHCATPQNGGNNCGGSAKEIMKCAHGQGEPDPSMCVGDFDQWSEWSHCDRTCGGGVMRRSRNCGETACQEDGRGRADKDEKSCNTNLCPVPSEYGAWSSWNCKEKCYNPYEKHLTREVKTRECINKFPKHEAANCDLMTHLREESQSPCTKIEQCPPLLEMRVKVCEQSHSGTNDNVIIKLKNGVNIICSTDELDDKGDDFETGSQKTWMKAFLSSCSKDFRPAEGLQVQIEMDTLGINIYSDELQLCKVEAIFGTGTEMGASRWIWSAKSNKSGKWNTIFPGYSNMISYTEWLDMCKECTTQQKEKLTTFEKTHCC